MKLTARKVEEEIARLLTLSSLSREVNGSVYFQGLRPRNSNKEDIILSFITGTTEEIEKGVVSVIIYCPDIQPYENGVYAPNLRRLAELESFAQEWVESLTLNQTAFKIEQMQAIYSEEEGTKNEHVVVIRLKYRYYGKIKLG